MRPMASYSLRLLAARASALFLSATLCLPSAGEQPLNEITLKIQFLHYVAQYAVWPKPKDVYSPQEKRFVLGVLGENPFGAALQNYFRGKSVKNREFVIKCFKNVQEAKACQMLFI